MPKRDNRLYIEDILDSAEAIKDNYTVNVLELIHDLKEDEAWDDL